MPGEAAGPQPPPKDAKAVAAVEQKAEEATAEAQPAKTDLASKAGESPAAVVAKERDAKRGSQGSEGQAKAKAQTQQMEGKDQDGTNTEQAAADAARAERDAREAEAKAQREAAARAEEARRQRAARLAARTAWAAVKAHVQALVSQGAQGSGP